jgi:hypothetical protein
LSVLLRSRLSPQQVRYRVSLPAGAMLQAAGAGAVVSDGNKLPAGGPITMKTSGTYSGYSNEEWKNRSGAEDSWTPPEKTGEVTAIELLDVSAAVEAIGEEKNIRPRISDTAIIRRGGNPGTNGGSNWARR